MAGKLADYLSTTTADYTATQLDIAPQKVMVESGSFRQKTVEFDDTNVAVLTRSTTPIFLFAIQWNGLTDADANTILDFYFDTAKAKGRARTFEFPHPHSNDTNTYIVRFWTKLERETRYRMKIKQIKLKVEGYKA